MRNGGMTDFRKVQIIPVRVSFVVLHAAVLMAPWDDAAMRHIKEKCLQNAESVAEHWG